MVRFCFGLVLGFTCSIIYGWVEQRLDSETELETLKKAAIENIRFQIGVFKSTKLVYISTQLAAIYPTSELASF